MPRLPAALLPAALLLAALPCAAAPGPSREATLAAAKKALRAESAAEFPALEERLSALPERNVEERLALGSLRRELGMLDGAERELQAALKLAPGDERAESALLDVYEDAGRSEDEVRLLNAMLAESPGNFGLYRTLAQAYVREGRLEDARATYARAKKLDGSAVAKAYVDEGYFELSGGEPGRARTDFESAIAVDTASYFGYHHMGAYLAKSGRYPEAEAFLRRALKMIAADPRAPQDAAPHTRRWLARVLVKEGRFSEAETLLLQNVREGGPSEPWHIGSDMHLARLYDADGETAKAEQFFRRAVDECAAPPRCNWATTAEALANLGFFYAERSRPADAEQTAARLEKLCAAVPPGPALAETLQRLADLYEKLGDDAKSAQVLARREQLHPRPGAALPALSWQ